MIGNMPAGQEHSDDPRWSDCELIRRWIEDGSQRDFEQLHARYSSFIIWILLDQRIPYEDAQDLQQLLWLKLLQIFAGERTASIDPAKDFGGYLARITKHLAADYWRDPRRKTVADSQILNGDATAGTSTGSVLETEGTRKQRTFDPDLALDFQDALGQLDPEDRQLIEWLRDGHTVKEIRHSLGSTYIHAWRRVRRAIGRLGDGLEEAYGPACG